MKTIKLKECPVCKKEEWYYLDSLRNHEYWFNKEWVYTDEMIGFKVCKDCGFLTYDYRDDKELSEHYDIERPVMRAGNIVTCNRKNEYHKAFLKDTDAIIDKDYKLKDDFKAIDIGMAQGSYVNMLNKEFNVSREQLYGTEYSEGFRAFAKNEYGFNTGKDIEEFGVDKFDLISYYHVLEHIQHPDKELQKIKGYLKDDGYLYIGIPVWFGNLEEPSGAPTTDFENLYHMNHVNVFTVQSFKNLIQSNGFEIVKENDTYYGYTVLCKKTDKPFEIKDKANYKEIEEDLIKQKDAIQYVSDPMPQKRDCGKAYEIYPNFPEAYMYHSIDWKNMKDFEKGKEILEKGMEIMPNNHRLTSQLAILYMQWDEQKPKKPQFMSNNVKKAEELFHKCLELKPADEQACYFLGMINGNFKKDYQQAVWYMKKVIELNPNKFGECWNNISYFYKQKESNE